jgi:hypothetical protein
MIIYKEKLYCQPFEVGCQTLDDWSKQARVEMANPMLKMIAEARHQSWRYLLTGDESWFFSSTDYEQMWLPQGENAPTRARHVISTPKVMIIIFWSPLGFPVIGALPAGESLQHDIVATTLHHRSRSSNRQMHDKTEAENL